MFKTLWVNNFEKVFLILAMSLMLSFEACIYELLVDLLSVLVVEFFLKYLNLAKILLLGLERMRRETLKKLVYLLLIKKL